MDASLQKADNLTYYKDRTIEILVCKYVKTMRIKTLEKEDDWNCVLIYSNEHETQQLFSVNKPVWLSKLLMKLCNNIKYTFRFVSIKL